MSHPVEWRAETPDERPQMVFTPCANITAYELAHIMQTMIIGMAGGKTGGTIDISPEMVDAMWLESRRHFTPKAP